MSIMKIINEMIMSINNGVMKVIINNEIMCIVMCGVLLFSD
jgi:hypothetical protein